MILSTHTSYNDTYAPLQYLWIRNSFGSELTSTSSIVLFAVNRNTPHAKCILIPQFRIHDQDFTAINGNSIEFPLPKTSLNKPHSKKSFYLRIHNQFRNQNSNCATEGNQNILPLATITTSLWRILHCKYIFYHYFRKSYIACKYTSLYNKLFQIFTLRQCLAY